MAIDPGSPNIATADLLRAAAVQLVDISAPGPNGETSGAALVVIGPGAGGATAVDIASPLVGGNKVGVADPSSALCSAALGTTADAPWDGVAAEASVISLLKSISINTGP